MSVGDLVVVPYGNQFLVARVTGPARYEKEFVDEDTSYRRAAEWLNNGVPILRKYARAALQSRMKIRQTCADASDLIAEIQDTLDVVAQGQTPHFEVDLRQKLIAETQKEICSGRLDSFGFERLVASVLRSLGASEIRIVPRNLDKGADILATFLLANTFSITLAVQAKHFQTDPPVGPEVVDQLAAGMEAEGVTLGWVATSGSFSDEAATRRSQLEERKGYRIELIDGESLAALVVEGGLRASK